MTKYNIEFADNYIMSIVADKVETNKKMLSFYLGGDLVGYIQLTKHISVYCHNFKEFEIISLTRFILEGDKIIETNSAVEKV